MSTKTMHARRALVAIRWRRALVALLLVVTGFAPVANAACELEALAGVLGSADAGFAVGTPAPSDPFDDSCCDHELDAFAVPAKLPVADGTLALPLAGAPVLAAERTPGIRFDRAGPIACQHSSAPPEPVSRRVSRLLL